MGRSRSDEQQREVVAFRLSADELAEVDRRARAAGQGRSAYARAAMLGGGAEAAQPPLRLVAEGREQAAHELAQQLRRVGVNLNQWVRHQNRTGEPPPPNEARLALLEIRQLIRQAHGLAP